MGCVLAIVLVIAVGAAIAIALCGRDAKPGQRATRLKVDFGEPEDE